MSADVRFTEMADALEMLAAIFRGEAQQRALDLDSLLDQYADMRHRLSHGISAISMERLPDAAQTMQQALTRIEQRLWQLCDSKVPLKKLKISGFTGVHSYLLEFLVLRVGKTVAGEQLRFLTADQTHTERRVRELREIGYDVLATRRAGRDSYILRDANQAVDDGARSHLQHLLQKKSRSFDSIELNALQSAAANLL